MTRERRVIEALVSLADTLTGDFDTLEFLYTLAERTAEMLEAAAVGVLLMDEAGHLEAVAATSADMRALELFEAHARQGPSYDAFATGGDVDEPDVKACADRWPLFSSRAVDLGHRAVYAAPLQRRGERIGAMNAYHDTVGGFDIADHRLMRALADMAAISLITADALRARQDQIDNQRQALHARATVEQAKGMLAERLGITTDDAFDRLRRHARNHNHKLRDVAHRFTRGELGHEDLVVS